ncbi:MAG TPA: excinuclease ABC subunit UvrC [Candidatus Binatia bacterium]|nr:excinuclease ABC subunit UvrC [Candidatus Binatia bacterium]
MTREEQRERSPAAGEAAAVPRPAEDRLAAVPPRPGVYLLKDRHGKVIYVGKATNLRGRIRTYLRGGDERSQVRFLCERLADFETIVTANDKEALILENNLIKQYRPRYNIRLKDDKSYVSVKVTVQDPWPRVLVTRRIVKDGSRYFGPFASASAVRDTLDTIRKVFPLRTCSDPVFRNRSRPCIEYDIKRCLGPCVLPVDRAAYEEHLRQVMLLLEGRNSEVVRHLRRRMDEAARAERFEEAARLRDQIRAIETTQERQQVAEHWGGDQDVFGVYREGGCVEVQVLFVRSGKLVSNRSYSFDDWEFPDEEVLEAVLTQFYQATTHDVPDEILLPVAISDAEVRGEYLSERRGKKVTILVPQRGDKLRLVEMARENAQQAFAERRDASKQAEHMIAELRQRLHLANAPKRIECLDIATFQGTETVGAIVAFDEGEADKDGYRHYRIRTVEGTDDFAAVAEVLRRRFRDGGARGGLPDLLVIDGGLGQLGAARVVLEELGIGVEVVALAKERVERDPTATEIRRRPERVFLPGRKNPVVLKPNSTALFLLQRVRDEAHRFVNLYHRKLRARARFTSKLDAVPGVGPRRRRALLRRFGSLRRVGEATAEEIAAVPGITLTLATQIKERLAKS